MLTLLIFRMSVMRDKTTEQDEFSRYCDRLCTILAEHGFAEFVSKKEIITPCGTIHGWKYIEPSKIMLVTVMRSGDILAEAFRKLNPAVKVGKILIQRDENDPEKRPKLFYSKFPSLSEVEKIILVDPMLATAGSAICATQVLEKAGFNLSNLLFVNCISCPEGIKNYVSKYPSVRILTAAVDSHLNEHKYIVPGLGDFGDRYFGTS